MTSPPPAPSLASKWRKTLLRVVLPAAVAVAVSTNTGELLGLAAPPAAGNAALSISTPGSGASVLSIPNLRPGDTKAYKMTIENSGSVPFTYALSVAAQPGKSSVLDTNAALGLQLKVERCNSAFASCSAPLYNGRIVVTNLDLGGPDNLPGPGSPKGLKKGSKDYLRLTASLPSGAGNAFQGKTSVLDLTWTATQATGGA